MINTWPNSGKSISMMSFRMVVIYYFFKLPYKIIIGYDLYSIIMAGVYTFLTNENASTLWEVLKENAFKTKNPQEIVAMRSNFSQRMTTFFDEERENSKALIDLNKKFILNFMQTSDKKMQSNAMSTNNMPSLMPGNKSGLYKVEDIQEARIQQFDKQYEQRKQEFENAMTPRVPDSPNFTDNFNDAPLENMESLIAETMRQRNFDIDQIVNSSNTNKTAVENWLHPQETSLKTENRASNEQNFKLIKIENEEVGSRFFENDVINLTAANTNANRSPTANGQKKLSWAEKNETRVFNTDENVSMDIRESSFNQMKQEEFFANPSSTDDIFSRLKPVQPSLSLFETETREEKGFEQDNLLQQFLHLDKKIDIVLKNQTILMEILQKMQSPIESNLAKQ